MLYSTQTLELSRTFGILTAIDILADAGFTALDLSFDGELEKILDGDYVSAANEIKSRADARGVKFIQAHAPFGGGYDYYLGTTVPKFPAMFEVCKILGISFVVIHPLQTGRYYGNEEKLFDMNLRFYSALAPLARASGVKIAIENMWQRHPVTHAICDDVLAPPSELVKMYDALNDPEAFTVCLDLGHVALCGREPEDAIRIIGRERLGTLHVHDVDYVSDLHTLPGCGKINWDNVCRALGEIDYTGSINLEADGFFRGFAKGTEHGFFTEVHAEAARFMAVVSRSLAEKVDLYRP